MKCPLILEIIIYTFHRNKLFIFLRSVRIFYHFKHSQAINRKKNVPARKILSGRSNMTLLLTLTVHPTVLLQNIQTVCWFEHVRRTGGHWSLLTIIPVRTFVPSFVRTMPICKWSVTWCARVAKKKKIRKSKRTSIVTHIHSHIWDEAKEKKKNNWKKKYNRMTYKI